MNLFFLIVAQCTLYKISCFNHSNCMALWLWVRSYYCAIIITVHSQNTLVFPNWNFAHTVHYFPIPNSWFPVILETLMWGRKDVAWVILIILLLSSLLQHGENLSKVCYIHSPRHLLPKLGEWINKCKILSVCLFIPLFLSNKHNK